MMPILQILKRNWNDRIVFAQKTRSDYSKTLDSEINKLYSDASMTKAVQMKKKSRTKK